MEMWWLIAGVGLLLLIMRRLISKDKLWYISKDKYCNCSLDEMAHG